MKSVLIIGMGQYGNHLCERLYALGNEIMIVDIKALTIPFNDFVDRMSALGRREGLEIHAMQPMPTGNFRQEILGYSLMNALGISADELK